MDIIKVLHLDRYLSTRIILCADVIVFVITSCLALMATCVILRYRSVSFNLWVWWGGGAFVWTCVLCCLLRTHRIIIRHSSLGQLWKFGLLAIAKVALLMGGIALFSGFRYSKMELCTIALLDFCFTFFALICMRILMVMCYDLIKHYIRGDVQRKNILVYGVGDKSVATITRLANSPHYNICGFIIPKKHRESKNIEGYQIYTFTTKEEFDAICSANLIDAILFTTAAAAREEQQSIFEWCGKSSKVITLMAPPIAEVDGDNINRITMREIKIEDLLGRDEIQISLTQIKQLFGNKVIMVTGAAGSIGSELCRQLAKFNIKQLILFDDAETPMHNIRLELEDKFPQLNFVPFIGDVRSVDRLDCAFKLFHPQVVFHAAAYKHVPLMEENPCEAVKANVGGSANVADKCIQYGIEAMVMISTDKAVNPTNVMGCTKRLAEIYVQSLGLAEKAGKIVGNTKFVTTRFGNVLGSNGSVIPRFRQQIAEGGPVTVTDPEITRFFMTIPEACRLVMEAATISDGNQIFVFDMGESVKIADLARKMIELSGYKVGKDIRIEYTGLRPGEKLYEEVLANNENTLPTTHNRIRIAKVRKYDLTEAKKAVKELVELATKEDEWAVVEKMKEVVPEFKSQNSRFERLDK